MARWRETPPTGTVTFLFSDIEGSTELVQELDTAGYRELIEEHQRLLRAAFSAHGGVERGTEGDSFLVVFRDAPSAVAAAVEAQRSLQSAGWASAREVRVRVGLHSGEGIRGGDDYIGVDINRAARIASAAHGGQVLISESTRALSDRNLPSGVGLRDLGEHRLKGLALPERIYQLVIEGLISAFPPPLTIPASTAHLPARLTTFIGREADLDDVRRLLVHNRLVTLIGPGGTGKTSLATECAREVVGDYPEGAWFVALEAVRDPELVPSEIVAALGLRDVSGRSALELVKDNLSRRELLLVLDNFEQVIQASLLVRDLLAAAPGVRMLVTSRTPLHLGGEQLYPVPPLAVPAPLDPADAAHDRADPIELMSVPAVRLFVDRAQRVQPAFRLTAENAAAVADICARLDGLPLGIELAAARVPLLGAAGIRDRLVQRAGLPAMPNRDAPARQETLREAIAWSHELLDAPGRALCARLSVFVGGCRIEQAVTVCGPDSELGADVEDTLASLVDHSLVTVSPAGDEVRYGMLETILAYAADRLTERGERPEIERRHAAAYLALAEGFAPALGTRERGVVVRRFRAEADNLQAAVRWSIETGETETGLRLAAAMGAYWRLEGRIVERRSATLAILDIPGARAPSQWGMRALETAGSLFYYSGDNARADSFYAAQLEMAETLGDRQGMADATFNLAWTRDWRGRPKEASVRLDELAQAYRELGDERSLARTEVLRGGLLLAHNEQEARRVLEAAHARFRELDDVIYEAMAASMVGGAYLQLGERRAAARWFVEVLLVSRDMGDLPGITPVLPIEAVAALELGRPESAAVILGAFDALSLRYGVRPPVGLEQVVVVMDPRGRAKAELDPEAFDVAMRRGRQMTLEEVVAYVLEIAEPLM
jgi:predicted ATPase/class 3 adenylate cyclase